MLKMSVTRFFVVAILLSSFISVLYAENQSTYLVGVAKIDITPEYPVLLSGYASRSTELISRVEQQLWARAIAVKNEQGQPHVLIAVDNCGVPASVTKAVVANLKQKYKINAENVVISSTHTHSAPMLNGVLHNLYMKDLSPEELARIDRYTQELVTSLVQVAEKAIKDAQPSILEWGISVADFAKNRRLITGPKDHSLPILHVKSIEGQSRAILVNYACHCTTLGGVPFMSGDWAGCAVEGIESDTPGCMGMVVIGCGADQNPKIRGDDQGAARVNGQVIAKGVRQRLKTELTRISGNLIATNKELVLPLDTPPTREEWEEQKNKKGITGYFARKNLRRLKQGQALTDKIVYPVTSWVFGNDLAMVFLGGEVVVDYSLALKQTHGAKIWVTAYSNDVPCYIPSERVLQEGGYEGRNAMVWYDLPASLAPGLEKKILDEVDRQLPASFRAEVDVSQTGGKRPLSPAESISRMNYADNLKVELVAAEPLVIDPVAIEFGPDGKLWVVEMRDYPLGIDGNMKPGGVVKYLEDLDQDGVYDKATVFLEGLAFPTGLMVWKKGVLVCAAPDVIYAEDTSGDGKADVQRKILTGFATHNFQARVNSLVPGLDNWVYASGGLFGGIIKSFNGQTVNVTNRDFRFQPETGELEPVSGRSQQGRVRDDWGNWFGCRNGSLCLHYPVTESYFRKNPFVVSPPPEVSVPQGSHRSELFPVGELVQFHLSGPRGRPTSVCGLGLYRDRKLGDDFYGNAFLCEPVNQLVHRMLVHPKGVSFAGERAAEEQDRDFLTSTDNWFRPVQARMSPDGTVMIVDMYRYLIEHPKWLSPEAVAKLNVRAGETRGRIYRISRKDQERIPAPNLKKLSSVELANLLKSSNGTLRDMVQQELLLRSASETIPIIKSIAVNADLPESRVQALSSLEGLQALDSDLLLSRINDPVAGVRREVVRLSEPFLNKSNELANAVLERTKNERNLSVILQLAYSLGELKGDVATQGLLKLMRDHSANVYIRSAVLTSFEPDRLAPAITVLIPQISSKPKLLPVYEALLAMAIATKDKATLKTILECMLEGTVKNQELQLWEWDSLSQILRGLNHEKVNEDAAVHQQVQLLRERASQLISDHQSHEKYRIGAIEFVMSAGQSLEDIGLISDLLSPQTPLKIQVAALCSLINTQNSSAIQTVLKNWKQYTPALRVEVLDQLLSRESTTVELLKSIEQKLIQPAQIDLTNRDKLTKHKSPEISQRARKIFSVATSASRAAVLKQYQSIDLKQGNIQRGSVVFEKQCAACHRLNGKGHVVGPDLAALTDQSKSFLLTSLLDPNKAVDGRYASYLAVTYEGMIHTGILVSEQSNSITLKGQKGKVQTILRTQLEELQNTGKSLMPEGLEREISLEAMADLLVFLQENSSSIKYKYVGAVKPDAAYPDDPNKPKLVNQSTGSARFNDGQWVGFRFAGTQPQSGIDFDLGKKIPIRSLKIVYGVNHEPGTIHAPASVLISFSNNGEQYGNHLKFSGFDNHPDGLGLYGIDGRTVEINLPQQQSRFVRIKFQGKKGWVFLSEISVDSHAADTLSQAVPVSSGEVKPKTVPVDPVAKIKSLVASVKVGTVDEYREIPEIWRTAIALGKRNQVDEIRKLLEASLPEKGGALQRWQAVVIGGGIINGITIAGDWPRARIETILKDDAKLAARWKQALLQSVKMADDPKIKSGTRYDALRMIAMLDFKSCKAQLKKYLANSKQAELQMGAVSGLGDIDCEASTLLLINAVPELNQRNRKLALEALLRTENRARALLNATQMQKITAKMIDATVQKLLIEHSNEEIQKQAKQLFD
ncbi:neutral/alkaline non-lysosomal ceramidase N-terminal domain-containing protein [Gimesia aquarii]|uniref:Neutral/alkaline non-lysosomal ceramidase n=1 Tax=Gimesia aquarii TaxID=2527964 RepID=A0A517WXR2_9PLAN|nr:neutral/alkaline non-lysosomal ceramidase N-terminal domain-containing protein [Gimesia aquarii]QDU10039.1 Neutral/alkaline non-lysosomal ceramidase [Gimesia aquarii]